MKSGRNSRAELFEVLDKPSYFNFFTPQSDAFTPSGARLATLSLVTSGSCSIFRRQRKNRARARSSQSRVAFKSTGDFYEHSRVGLASSARVLLSALQHRPGGTSRSH